MSPLLGYLLGIKGKHGVTWVVYAPFFIVLTPQGQTEFSGCERIENIYLHMNNGTRVLEIFVLSLRWAFRKTCVLDSNYEKGLSREWYIKSNLYASDWSNFNAGTTHWLCVYMRRWVVAIFCDPASTWKYESFQLQTLATHLAFIGKINDISWTITGIRTWVISLIYMHTWT